MKFYLQMAFVSVLLSTSAYADFCSCQEWGSAAEMVKDSDAAFLAIPAAKSIRTGEDGEIGGPLMRTKMSVVRDYKNTSLKEVSVFAGGGDSAECGVQFKRDEGMYIILGYKDAKGNLHTSGCSVMHIGSDRESMKFLREYNKL